MKISFFNIGKQLTLLFLMVFITIPSFGAVDPDSLNEFTERGMKLWNVPGMSVAVVKKDKILFQKGYGTTAIENGQSVDEHTLFAIASTTKAMVVAGILILVDEGKLSLDDLIIKHIPELHFEDPSLTQQVTVRDLLAHRTGLPSTDYWPFLQNTPLDEQLILLQKVQAFAPVRTRLIYQNTMFEIAGIVIERLSGLRWDEFLTKRLWKPIGMFETYSTRSQIGEEHSYVKPHFYFENQVIEARWDIPLNKSDASGSVWSSIHDMSLWAQFLLSNGVTADSTRLISKKSIEEMFEPHQLSATYDFYPTIELTKPNWRSYGLAWFQQDFQGRKIDYHTGSLSGLTAIIGLDRASNIAIIALGNRDHAELRHALLWEVMDNSIENSRRDWNYEVFDLYEKRANEREKNWEETCKKQIKNTKTSLPMDAYQGKYQSSIIGNIIVEKSDSMLIYKSELIEFEMSHWHFDTFLFKNLPMQVKDFATFTIGIDGTVSSFELYGYTYERIKDDETDK
ncbi:MAG: serine hydrolase [Bacteroidota bacterium]